jgi:hypothetical protein
MALATKSLYGTKHPCLLASISYYKTQFADFTASFARQLDDFVD